MNWKQKIETQIAECRRYAENESDALHDYANTMDDCMAEIERLRDRIARAMIEDAEQKTEIERLQADSNKWREAYNSRTVEANRLRTALKQISKRARQKWNEGKEDCWLWVYKTADQALRDE